MEVRKKNNKIKFKLDEEYLIVKRFFKDKKIKRDSIRSAMISGNTLLILTYNNKIYNFTSLDKSFEYIERMKLLVNEINKENIVFTNWRNEMPVLFIIIATNNIVINISKYNNFEFYMYTLLFLFYTILIIKMMRGSYVLYNVDKSEFVKFKMGGKVLSKFYINDVEIKQHLNEYTRYKNIRDSYTFEIKNRYDKVIYPIKCVNAIIEINNKTKQSIK